MLGRVISVYGKCPRTCRRPRHVLKSVEKNTHFFSDIMSGQKKNIEKIKENVKFSF